MDVIIAILGLAMVFVLGFLTAIELIDYVGDDDK